MKKNPNITIEAEYGSWDGHYQKLVTQLAGGTAPDLMQTDNTRKQLYTDVNTG